MALLINSQNLLFGLAQTSILDHVILLDYSGYLVWFVHWAAFYLGMFMVYNEHSSCLQIWMVVLLNEVGTSQVSLSCTGLCTVMVHAHNMVHTCAQIIVQMCIFVYKCAHFVW